MGKKWKNSKKCLALAWEEGLEHSASYFVGIRIRLSTLKYIRELTEVKDKYSDHSS